MPVNFYPSREPEVTRVLLLSSSFFNTSNVYFTNIFSNAYSSYAASITYFSPTGSIFSQLNYRWLNNVSEVSGNLYRSITTNASGDGFGVDRLNNAQTQTLGYLAPLSPNSSVSQNIIEANFYFQGTFPRIVWTGSGVTPGASNGAGFTLTQGSTTYVANAATQTVDGIRLYQASNTAFSGSFKLYGIK